ncbi:MAG: formate dehydrogenase accessory protein FdhE [Anaerolineae bacterium]|nr:formate dehydrogenase accessory protein FdhE [Anaerolineae bacterium]
MELSYTRSFTITNITIHPIERVISALDELIDDNPELEKAVDFYEELLPLLYAARPTLDGLTLNIEAAQAKLREGVPLLWGEFRTADTLAVEPDLELFMTLCRLATEGGNQAGEILMRAVLDGELNLKAALSHTLTLDRAGLTTLARSLNVDLDLLEATTRYVLSPITWAYAGAFDQALDFGHWQRGYCPVCGDWPVLGELRGRDRLRYLRCGRCGLGWKFKRLQCVWCDNTNKKELSFLFDPDQPTWRVEICDYCRGYVKTIITFDPLEADMLPVYDLKTMLMDQMAVNEGYKRPFKQPLTAS